MASTRPPYQPGEGIRAWLKDWLEMARPAVENAREHYGPEQEAEVLAEVRFYEGMLHFLNTGKAPAPTVARPSPLVINTTLSALDHTVERAREWADSTRTRGDEDRLRSALEDERLALRLRTFVESVVADQSVDG
jgi:hypothetical protein